MSAKISNVARSSRTAAARPRRRDPPLALTVDQGGPCELDCLPDSPSSRRRPPSGSGAVPPRAGNAQRHHLLLLQYGPAFGGRGHAEFLSPAGRSAERPQKERQAVRPCGHYGHRHRQDTVLGELHELPAADVGSHPSFDHLVDQHGQQHRPARELEAGARRPVDDGRALLRSLREGNASHPRCSSTAALRIGMDEKDFFIFPSRRTTAARTSGGGLRSPGRRSAGRTETNGPTSAPTSAKGPVGKPPGRVGHGRSPMDNGAPRMAGRGADLITNHVHDECRRHVHRRRRRHRQVHV